MKEKADLTQDEQKILKLFAKLTEFERYWVMIYVAHLLAKDEIKKGESNK